MARNFPWWSVVAAAIAPVLLVGGWTLAAALQPRGYDPIRDTISALAARGAADRWVMTAALAGLGVCYLLAAAGLRPARRLGRAFLAMGGVATLLVATFPQPIAGNSIAHTVAATIAFVALATWPAIASRRGAASPLLSPTVALAASALLGALVLWFVIELHGGHRGLAERAAAVGEALFPLAAVLTTQRRAALES